MRKLNKMWKTEPNRLIPYSVWLSKTTTRDWFLSSPHSYSSLSTEICRQKRGKDRAKLHGSRSVTLLHGTRKETLLSVSVSPWAARWSCLSSWWAQCRPPIPGPTISCRRRRPSDPSPAPPAAESCAASLWKDKIADLNWKSGYTFTFFNYNFWKKCSLRLRPWQSLELCNDIIWAISSMT